MELIRAVLFIKTSFSLFIWLFCKNKFKNIDMDDILD